MTKLGKRNITLKNPEELLEGVISRKIAQKKARKMYNNIANDTNELNSLKPTESTKKNAAYF